MSERGARSIAVLAATGKWPSASRIGYQSRGRARGHVPTRPIGAAACRNQRDGLCRDGRGNMGSPMAIGLAEIVVEMDGVEERPPGIAGVLGRQGRIWSEPLAASRRNDQHAKSVRVVSVLQLFVQADLPLPTVGVLVGSDPLGAVVQFDEEVELLPVGRVEFEGAVGKEVLLADWSRRVFSREKFVQGDAPAMGGDDGMDDELGQAVRVVVMGNADLGEVPLRGRLGVLAVEQAVTRAASACSSRAIRRGWRWHRSTGAPSRRRGVFAGGPERCGGW